MPRLAANVRSALADYWNLAVEQAGNRTGSASFISIAASLAREAGGTISFNTAKALPVLYGYASRVRNAGESIRNASDETFIGPEHVAVPPWAREETAQLAAPIWHVTYLFTAANSAGIVSQEYKTSIFEHTGFPQTVGQLKDAIQADAQALADKYGVNLINVDLHQVLAV
jgi:hypothetical protein